jgi:hypothetical protein
MQQPTASARVALTILTRCDDEFDDLPNETYGPPAQPLGGIPVTRGQGGLETRHLVIASLAHIIPFYASAYFVSTVPNLHHRAKLETI